MNEEKISSNSKNKAFIIIVNTLQIKVFPNQFEYLKYKF